MKTTRKQRKSDHRQLTKLGVPRHKDGNRLGLAKRMSIAKAMAE